METITLTNGAANWGIRLLNQSKTNLADLFVSGGLARKFSPAKIFPHKSEGESDSDYEARIAVWLDTPLADCLEVSNEERDFMRNLLKDLGGKKELPANIHVADLARSFNLDKA